MLTKLIAIGVFVGLIIYLIGRESERNDKYNQTKLEDEKSSDEDIDTHY